MRDRFEISLSQGQIDEAVQRQLLTPEQGSQLWLFWSQQKRQKASFFDFVSLLQYLGMAGVLAAMGQFALSHHLLGNFGLALTSTLYMLTFLGIGYWLWQKPGTRFAGGLFLTLSVCMIPLAIYGIETGLELWPQLPPDRLTWGEKGHEFDLLLRTHQLRLEAATAVGATLLLNFFSFPLLLLPLVISGWFLFLDVIPLLFPYHLFLWREFLEITAAYGAGLLLFAYKFDRKGQHVFSSWTYFIGLAFAWSAATALVWDSSEWMKIGYFVANASLLILSFTLNRTVFLLFGASGVLGYCCYLTERFVISPFLSTLAISVIGVAALYLGILFQKYCHYSRGFSPSKHQ